MLYPSRALWDGMSMGQWAFVFTHKVHSNSGELALEVINMNREKELADQIKRFDDWRISELEYFNKPDGSGAI